MKINKERKGTRGKVKEEGRQEGRQEVIWLREEEGKQQEGLKRKQGQHQYGSHCRYQHYKQLTARHHRDAASLPQQRRGSVQEE